MDNFNYQLQSKTHITPIHCIPKHCSQCGEKLITQFIEEENCERLFCNICKRIEYRNPKVVAGAIPTQNGKVVLLRRGIEPQKGFWTYPAGFVELGETIPSAAARECLEETGLQIKVGELLGVYSYADAGVVMIIYFAEVISGIPTICRETLEIQNYNIQDIPWEELAFRSTRDALQDWVKKTQK